MRHPWFNIQSTTRSSSFQVIRVIIIFYNFQNTNIIHSFEYQNNQVHIILIILLYMKNTDKYY